MNSSKLSIEIAQNAGFCFGVKRTLAMVEDNLDKMQKPVKIYGHLVHNEEVIKKLVAQGMEIINDLKEANEGTLIITAHGISPLVKEELISRENLEVLDTTCPKVLRVQNLAKFLKQQERIVLIFGDASHIEVKGINGAANEEGIIFSQKEELAKIKIDSQKKYGLVVQTTQDFEKFQEIEKEIKKRIKDILIFNTICEATRSRQKEVRELARDKDIVLVIGSRSSANTNRLYQISLEINPHSYLISTSKEIMNDWFDDKNKVGITAGASTPDWIIKEVIDRLKII